MKRSVYIVCNLCVRCTVCMHAWWYVCIYEICVYCGVYDVWVRYVVYAICMCMSDVYVGSVCLWIVYICVCICMCGMWYGCVCVSVCYIIIPEGRKQMPTWDLTVAVRNGVSFFTLRRTASHLCSPVFTIPSCLPC